MAFIRRPASACDTTARRIASAGGRMETGVCRSEFVSEDRREQGTRRLYPNGFHTTPCVCMRYNRKAYSERGGPHGDWRLQIGIRKRGSARTGYPSPVSEWLSYDALRLHAIQPQGV